MPRAIRRREVFASVDAGYLDLDNRVNDISGDRLNLNFGPGCLFRIQIPEVGPGESLIVKRPGSSRSLVHLTGGNLLGQGHEHRMMRGMGAGLRAARPSLVQHQNRGCAGIDSDQ